MICVIICGCSVVSLAKTSYSHQINYSHIHIKGKIATADGKGVADASLYLQNVGTSTWKVQTPFVTGVPSGTEVKALASVSGTGGAPCTYKTSASGEYEIILEFVPAPHQDVPDVTTFSIDRSKMEWKKVGYTIKSK
jgi:hypothetical protein